MAVRRRAGDRSVLSRGPRVQGQVPLLLPRGGTGRGAEERGQGRRSLDGRMGGILLRHEPRCEYTDACFSAVSYKMIRNQ